MVCKGGLTSKNWPRSHDKPDTEERRKHARKEANGMICEWLFWRLDRSRQSLQEFGKIRTKVSAEALIKLARTRRFQVEELLEATGYDEAKWE